MITASRTLLTYGRFDMFSQHHIGFLRRLSAMGQELIVGCATEAHAAAQGLACVMSFEERRALLESCRYVSRVIPLSDLAQVRTDIVNYNVSALAMGLEHQNQFDDVQDITQVLYLARVPVSQNSHVTQAFAAVAG